MGRPGGQCEYVCQYRSSEGKVCGRACKHPDGCSIHRKRRYRPPCKQDGCERPTASKHGFCNWHVNKYHSNEYYHRKKLDKMYQNGQTSEAMREALDKIKIPNVANWP
jgi:hypothetical protein